MLIWTLISCDKALPPVVQSATEDTWAPDTALVECMSEDADGDGWCADLDCDDTNASLNPQARDDNCDGIDNDCDGTADEDSTLSRFYADTDNDGYGDPKTPVSACRRPAAHVSNESDCDDDDGQAYPGAPETCGDGVDQNCDGSDQAC